MRAVRASVVVVLLGVLAACGGNGGGAPSDMPTSDGGGVPDEGGRPPTDAGQPDADADTDAAKKGDAVDMQVFASGSDMLNPAQNPLVISQATQVDSGGTTSVRFSSNKPIDDNLYPVNSVNRNQIAGPSERKVEERDRDLGQTFLTGDKSFLLDAVSLRIGFSDSAVLAGAPGANVALQFFEIKGYPSVNDSGSPGFTKNADGTPTFDRTTSPQLDDFLVGETYVSLLVANGKLPAVMNKGDYLTFKLGDAGHIALKPHQGYAFVLLFTDRAPDRSLGLANAYYGNYRPDNVNGLVGHGIRREGGSGDPASPFFKPDLPDDVQARTAQSPGTLGFPDVDTWRDFYFCVSAVSGSLK